MYNIKVLLPSLISVSTMLQKSSAGPAPNKNHVHNTLCVYESVLTHETNLFLEINVKREAQFRPVCRRSKVEQMHSMF